MTDLRCEISDLPRDQCAHCGARPGDRPVDLPDIGPAMIRRDVFAEVPLPTDSFKRTTKSNARSQAATCTCGKETRDHAYVCSDCLDEVTKALGNVPWIVEQLDISLIKARGIDYAALGSDHLAHVPLAHVDIDDDGDKLADAATTLPYYDAAAGGLANLRHCLAMWVRFCEEEQIRHQSPATGYPEDTLQAMSVWLLWRVDGLAFNDLGPDVIAEITRAVGRCFAIIDRPAERRYAGPCECGRDLYSKPGAKITQCPACEKTYDVEAMQEWMRAGVSGRLVTAREGVTLLGRYGLPTAQKTVDKWHERKRLTERGTNAAGARLYLIDDLISLAAQHAPRTA